MWSLLAPAYDLPVLQRWVYRPPHDEVIAQLRAHGSRKIADIACGTGILSDRVQRELDPDEIYGVDMSDGMLNQARAKSNRVQWGGVDVTRPRGDLSCCGRYGQSQRLVVTARRASKGWRDDGCRRREADDGAPRLPEGCYR
ncbi:hypothetical protein MGAST_11595 [Mycobacterium gastri 'Wayne']|nr:hypothetical protein MGAST_11595 [Mycobacterium gastri 'Wayne']